MRRFLPVLLLLSFALACGGDDDDGSASGSASGSGSGSIASAVEDEESTDTTLSDVASDGAPCEAAQAVADLDDAFQAELNDVLQRVMTASSSEEAEAAMNELGPLLAALDLDPLLDAYGVLERELDGEDAEAAGTLRSFTEDFVEKLRAAESAEEMTAMLEELGTDEGAAAAGQAALTLDAWSRETCDVTIAD